MVPVLGHPVWAGYFMLLALLWSTVPAHFLGKAKEPLAEQLHDKVLFADADTNRDDWHMDVAAILGIIGIGWWWADATAGILLSTNLNYQRATLGSVRKVKQGTELQHLQAAPQRVINVAQPNAGPGLAQP
ncbi:MAG: hypothetical protein EOO63_06710 [Hymenobacter sp.]|nr:MAG: hypothetical protein EOO63_06710 [Hymenobacter sp.]